MSLWNITTTNASTTEPLDWEAMKRIIARFPRRNPADHCVRIELHVATYDRLTRDTPPHREACSPCVSLCGIELDLSRMYELPWGCSLHHMADGSSVMHYRTGRAVRCLSEDS